MATEAAPSPRTDAATSAPLITKGWVQGVALVMIFGFLVMGILVYRAYTASMPMPNKVVSESGTVLFTGTDITHGQELYQARGLMEYGSVLGHGAYLGPDYTAEYLRLATDDVAAQWHGAGVADPRDAVVAEFRTNRFNPDTKTLVFTDKQARAFADIQRHYAAYFGENSTKYGLRPRMITEKAEIHDLTAFFAWTAWAAAAERPGHSYSYTNNWPSERRVDNGPTAPVIVWSALSLVALLGGIGIMFAVYGRWSQQVGWHSAEASTLSFRQPGEVSLTPAQRATIWFFAIVSVLFLAQTLVGAAAEHYRADLSTFFGLDLARVLPYNLARTWHVQLSLFWTAAAFLAGGIFLVPFIARREPKRQSWLVYGLLGAVAVVVFGSLITEALSIYGVIPAGGLFSQQWEYLDLPRLWQILLIVGLFLWIAIIWRGMRSRLRVESKMNMPWLFFFAGLAIPVFYTVGLLASSGTHYTVADFWRFWVVHLWVEDFLELFTTVMVAYIFVLLGVVRERIALGVIFLDVILYSAGGVIGTMHHLYFSGTPVEHMALGAFFSAAEVIPLTFLTVEAWAFLQLGSRQQSGDAKPFPHRWAVMFLVAVGFWNFVGAGIFGFLINLPVVSYYQIGTALTANHAHAAMFGVYGMLAVGLAMFAFRYVIPADKWPEKLARISFWGMNIGLAWMVFATLLPLGVLQLLHSVNDGYYEARSLGYITRPGNSLIEWLRLPGDLILIIGGVLPFIWIAWTALRNFRAGSIAEELPEHPLYTDTASRSHRRTDVSAPGASVWLVAGYALVLVAIAWCFDEMARRVSRRAARWRTGGFVYHPDHDAWACPQDQWLWPTSFDPQHRVMRYRASPVVCNSCPVKSNCTTSDYGREVSREVDPWPYSDIGRFHRGIACSVAGLGVVMPLAMLIGQHTAADVVVLVAAGLLVVIAGLPLARHLWNSPSNAPDHLPHRSASEDQVAVAIDQYSTRWGGGWTDKERTQ